jgi:hypothetical protein
MSALKIKSLHEHFSGLEKEIWVQNVSNPQGNIVVTIDIETGESVTIPKGPDPLPLTERFTFDKLKKSNELRQLVMDKKYLRILTSEEADEYYSKKGKNRYDNVTKRQSQLEQKVMNDALDTIQQVEQGKATVGNVLGETVKKAEELIPPKIYDLENQFRNKVLTEDDYIEQLRLIITDINEESLAYLQSKTKNAKKVKDFLKEVQKEIVSTDE